MKKLLTIIMVVMLCFLTLPTSVAADEWTDITEASQIATNTNGKYKLSNDITLSSTLNFATQNVSVEIDLNGYTLYGSPSAYMFRLAGVDLTISDSSAGQTGRVVPQTTNQNRAVVWMVGGVVSHFTLNGGTIDGSASTAVTAAGCFGRIETPSYFTVNGGAIQNFTTTQAGGILYVTAAATVTINGGTFSGNSAINGGCFYLNDSAGATLITTGGTFTGNTNTSEAGSVVYVRQGNSMYLNGGTFTGNTATRGTIAIRNADAHLYVGGNPKVYGNTATTYGHDVFLANYGGSVATIEPSNIDVADDAMIYVSSNVEANDAVLGTVRNSNDVSNCFYDSRGNYGYRQVGSQILFGRLNDGNYYRPWTSNNTLPTATGYYFLTKDVNLTAAAVLGGGATVHLDLNGKTARQTTANNALYRYWGDNSNLFIEDYNPAGTVGMLTGTSGNSNANIIWMNSQYNTNNMYFTLKNGRISGNTSAGAAIRSDKGIAHITIDGGEVSNNSSFGIYLHSTNASDHNYFTMNGGAIKNNVVNANGAGLRADSGTNHITINGGEISGNSSNSGSAITVINNANNEVIINGGQIINNISTAANYGYAVEVDSSAPLKILGGTISGNTTSATNQRGVVKTNGTLTLGGTAVIDNNSANGVETNVTNYTGSRAVDGTTPLTTGASIGFTPTSAPTGGSSITIVAGNYVDYFTPDNSYFAIEYSGGNTVLSVVTYSVTLNTNGGTVRSDNVTSYIYGVGATLPTDVYYRHHAFAGWYDNAELEGEAITAIGAQESGNKTYYAAWVEGHTHDDCGDGINGVEWIPWTSNNSLPTDSNEINNKYYYLTQDVYLTSKQTIYRTVTICLNGYSIYEADNSSNTGALINASGKWVNPLTITNCKSTFGEDGLLTSTAGIYNSRATGTEGAVLVATGSSDQYPNVKLFGIKIANNANIRSANEEWMPGAIFWRSQNTLTIDSCVFEGNISGNTLDNTSTYGAGGAITIKEPGTVNITNTLFNGNIAGARGGAILMPSGVNANLNISNSKFVNNKVLSSDGTGGVLSLSDGTVNISNTIFENNDNGGNQGTVISAMNNKVSVSLTDVTIRNNTNSCSRTAYKAAVVAIDGAAITVGGRTIITGNTNSAGNPANLFLRPSSIDTPLYTNSLATGSSIGVGTIATVDASNPFTIVAGKDESAYLTSDNGNYIVKYQDGDTVLTMPTEVESADANLTIGENIDVNIDVELAGNYENYTVTYNFNGVDHEVEVVDNNPVINVNDVFAFQMAEPVTITVEYLGEVIDTIEYSVQDYCEYQIENSTDPYVVNLCKATLNYGAAAQLYFDGKEYNDGSYDTGSDKLVNANVDTTIPEASMPVNVQNRTGDLGGLVTNVKYTLVLGSEVAMKFYIYTSEELDLENLLVGCNPAKTMTEVYKESEGRYSVKVTGIKASELGTDFDITFIYGVESMTITYSPYAFAAAKWDAGNSLAALCRTLVAYGNSALAN